MGQTESILIWLSILAGGPSALVLTTYFCVKLGTYAYLSAVRKFYLKHPKEFANGETRSRETEVGLLGREEGGTRS